MTCCGIRSGHRLIWIGVVVLIVLRQDHWFWDDPSLVAGILPIGLAWQVAISIAAALLWYTATRIAWPADPVETPTVVSHIGSAGEGAGVADVGAGSELGSVGGEISGGETSR